MLTARETAAPKRMQETVTLVKRTGRYHVAADHPDPVFANYYQVVCIGKGLVNKRFGVRASLSDLRLGFVRNLCPYCFTDLV